MTDAPPHPAPLFCLMFVLIHASVLLIAINMYATRNTRR